MKPLDEYYLNQEEPVKSCLLTLRSLINEYNKEITEAWKYKMPCFMFKGKMFCYLWVDKKRDWPYVLMVDGNSLKHPELEKGSRARMKVFYVNPNEDIPVCTLNEIINEGILLR